MDPNEYAQRVAAWTWAAMTLGQELDPDRAEGLVEMTKGVRIENLRPALIQVMQSNPSDFLPSPGLVIQAANRIAGERREAAQERLRESRRQNMIAAGRDKPANPEQIQEIRDAIEALANKAKYGNKKPWTDKLKDLNDTRGLDAARRAVKIAEEAADS